MLRSFIAIACCLTAFATACPAQSTPEVTISLMADAPATTAQTQEDVQKWVGQFEETIYRMRIHDFLERVDWRSIIQAGLSEGGEPPDEAKLEKMTKGMQFMSERMFPQLRPFFQFSKVEIRKIEADKDKMNLVTRCHDVDGIECKCRWWLVKAGEAWRLVDFENVTVAMRLSTLMNMAFQSQASSSPMNRELSMKFMQFGTLTEDGDFETALKIANELEKEKLPRSLLEIIQLAKVDILMALDKEEEAEPLLAQLEKQQCTNPAFYLLRAGRFFDLENYEASLVWSEKYGKAIGHDADSWRMVVNCHQELDQDKEALQAAKMWAADYPRDSSPLYFQWSLLPEVRRTLEVRPLLMHLPHAESFEAFGEAALMEDDYDAIRLLVDVMKARKMEREETVEWEAVLKDAPEGKPAEKKPEK